MIVIEEIPHYSGTAVNKQLRLVVFPTQHGNRNRNSNDCVCVCVVCFQYIQMRHQGASFDFVYLNTFDENMHYICCCRVVDIVNYFSVNS